MVLVDLDSVAFRIISQKALDRLLDILQTEVIPIANEHGGRVAVACFNGTLPFAGIKSRKDFPDALVYESVADAVRRRCRTGARGVGALITPDA
jgi:hypothetical protein